jgi:hypothetical protein
MKFRTTLVLLAAFVVLLAAVYFFELKNPGEKDTQGKLVSLSSDDVERIVFKQDGQIIRFQREGQDWSITSPLEAKADKYEVDRLADDFSDLKIERVVEEAPPDLDKYGIPQKEVELYYKGQENPVKILIGMENPLDKSFFAKRADEARVVLIPSLLKSLLEKNIFDFRQKNVFRFETDQAKTIKLRLKETQWEAEKKDDDWFLVHPVSALAQKSRITDILSSLSNLKAKEFVSEDKTEDELTEYGLDKPEGEVTVNLPLENQEVTFFIQKKDDRVYAASSLSSKILLVEDSILSDLGKSPDDLRDKKVADFYSWEVRKLQIKKGDFSLMLVKDEDDNWQFEAPQLGEADKDKVQSLLREIEALEAEDFVDAPSNLGNYGLITPQAEIGLWVGNKDEEPRGITIYIGSENKEQGKVYVKNTRFDYLFKVGSAFLDKFPFKPEEWKAQTEAEKEEEKKED